MWKSGMGKFFGIGAGSRRDAAVAKKRLLDCLRSDRCEQELQAHAEELRAIEPKSDSTASWTTSGHGASRSRHVGRPRRSSPRPLIQTLRYGQVGPITPPAMETPSP